MRLPRLQARDLLLPPNILSLMRLPLALLFPMVVGNAVSAFAVLCAAGLTDVFDGWLARRNGQVTAVGAIVDPVADKVFAITVVLTLVLHQRIPAWGIFALTAREILELPLLLWVLATRHGAAWKMGNAPADEPEVIARANVPGKLATVFQFCAVLSAIALPNMLNVLLAVAAIAGGLAGVAYWMRALRQQNKARKE